MSCWIPFICLRCKVQFKARLDDIPRDVNCPNGCGNAGQKYRTA